MANSSDSVSTTESKKKSLSPSTLRIGRRYRAKRLDENYDAIVVGSGIGGLTTAAGLSKMGKKVLVLEQHYTAGGFTHSYARNGYEWDVGVHYIGDMGRATMGRRVFDFITDSELKWAAMDPAYDRFFFGDESYDLIAGKENFRNEMKRRFPQEAEAIDKYLVMIKKVNDGMSFYTGSKLFAPWQQSAMQLVMKRRLPDYFNKTTYEALRTITDDEQLIAVLTGQWGDCGMTPKTSSFMIHSLIARHYLNGGYFPVGGASKMAETIIPVIQASGGEVFTYATVEEILVEKNKAIGVRMKDGEVIKAPMVVSNAGVFNTFERLLPEETARKSGYKKKLKTVKRSVGHLGMYIGLNGTAEELGLPKTNFWIYPDTHHDENIEAFYKDNQKQFPVVYISFPSAKDPSFASRYPGKATVEIVAPCNFDEFAPWKDKAWGKRGDDYEALKEGYSKRMLDVLYEKLPQLKGKIDYYETSTPLSTDFFCFYPEGEIYGIDHDPSRFDQKWLQPKTSIKGLYLTGQDVLSCGVVGAMMAGLLTAVKMLGVRGPMLAKKVFVDQKVEPDQEWVVSPNAEY